MSNPRHPLRLLSTASVSSALAFTGAFKGSAASSVKPTRLAAATLLAAPTLLLASLALIPAPASAYATLEGPPQYSAAPGLPDGRVYEQVSPADKNGNEAGANTTGFDVGALSHYGFASADGNAVLFEGTGPMGESSSGNSKWFVATKLAGEPGWSTRSLLPAEPAGIFGGTGLEYLDPSSDLSHAMVGTTSLLDGECFLCLVGPDPFAAATSLERAEIEAPIKDGLNYARESAPAGGSPDFSTVYFTHAGTLLPADASRAPHTGGEYEQGEAWGFYESRGGVLHEAGVLPADSAYPGGLDPFGAVPAASGHARNPSGNEVSTDGSRAFFVSPDPASCTYNDGQNDCASDPPELYVRENGERTQLVSEDTLLPRISGLAAAAPDGVLRTPNKVSQEGVPSALAGSYVFASPDGSQAFFQSEAALTEPAEEASPGAEPKTYDFDVDTSVLTYLPGVVGQIVATDTDGSSLAFVRSAGTSTPEELDLWSAGSGGGTVTPVTRLPEPGGSVPEARISSDGSALVFMTNSEISSNFNSGGFEQIYHYDVPTNTLGCVSCAPVGITPRGNASFSALHTGELSNEHDVAESPHGFVDGRGISSDGDRVFFESPDPLVPQDTNTDSPEEFCVEKQTCPQGNDVYEWENGVVYLISTGKSDRNTYLLDNSENGDDVFFATTDGLVPGDTDSGYDVYDARIPHPGDNPPAAAVPCEGAVCQGPPNVPSPLTPPASATFSGLGNPAPEAPAAAEPKKTTTRTAKCKKGQVKKKHKCVKKPKAKKSAKRSK